MSRDGMEETKMGRGWQVGSMMMLVVLAGSCAKSKATHEPAADRRTSIEIPRGRGAAETAGANPRSAPNDDPRLAYQIAVPASWSFSKDSGPPPAGMTPQGLGAFASSSAPGAPRIAVTVMRVPFEIPLDAWVRLSLAHDGYQILAASYFPGPNGLFFDATAARMVGAAGAAADRQEVLRTTVRSDGGNVFSVNTTCDQKDWDAAKDVFWSAHLSFKPSQGSGTSEMEARKFISADNPDFQTSRPASWSGERVKQESKDVSAVDLRLLNPARTVVLGYVQVKAQRASSEGPARDLAALRDDSLARLKRSLGYVPSQPFQPLTLTDDPRSEAVEGWLGGFSGEAKLADNDAAIRLGYVRRGGLTFSLLAISAPVRDDTAAALRTQRAFEIARATLRLPD